MTLKAPVCEQTKILPSGAIAIAVGLESPEICVSVKLAGRVANNKNKKPRMFTATDYTDRCVKNIMIRAVLVRPGSVVRTTTKNRVLGMVLHLELH